MSTLIAETISDGTDTVETTYVVSGPAKAMLYGTADAGTSGAVNISSGTDHGAGDYSYALTNSFTEGSFTTAQTAQDSASRNTVRNSPRHTEYTLAVATYNPSSGAKADSDHTVAAFGELA